MTDSLKLSRRDWFRLGRPQSNQLLGHQGAASSENVLKPIEQPPNHDGLDLSELPPMREAQLSISQIDALFSDIAGLATDIQLMQRAANSNRATSPHASSAQQLEMAKTALLSGKIARVQVRYRWQNKLWIDTLKRETEYFELVRVAHENV